MPVNIVEEVFREIRDQEWGRIFVFLSLILIPSGVAVFFLRDRYHRSCDVSSIQLKLTLK